MPAKYILQAERPCALQVPGENISFRQDQAQRVNAVAERTEIMAAPNQSIIETRRQQMFPILEPTEIERVRRFGKVRAYAAGEALATLPAVGVYMPRKVSGSSLDR
jgi:hypothetical protein